MLLDFDKFEQANKILETCSPADADALLVEAAGLSMCELESVNEGFLKDLFGGWFKKLKTNILRKVPGGVLRRVDEIISRYAKEKHDLMKRSLKEKEKIFKSEVGMSKDSGQTQKYEQIIDRAKTAISAIKKASDAKIEKFNTELEQLADGKSDMVSDYINLKIAEVQERIATAELVEIEKFATEEQVDKATKDVEDKKKAREELQKELEKAVGAAKDMAGMSAKRGEEWLRSAKDGKEVTVQIVEDPNKDKLGEVRVKSKGGNEYSAKVSSLIKKV